MIEFNLTKLYLSEYYSDSNWTFKHLTVILKLRLLRHSGLTIRFWLKEFRRFYPLSFNSIHQLITHYDKFSTDPIWNDPTSDQQWITWLKYHNSKTNLSLSFSVHTKNQWGLFIRESLIRMIWFMRLEIINKKIMDFRNILTMNVLIN